jgi:hypothetical protein
VCCLAPAQMRLAQSQRSMGRSEEAAAPLLLAAQGFVAALTCLQPLVYACKLWSSLQASAVRTKHRKRQCRVLLLLALLRNCVNSTCCVLSGGRVCQKCFRHLRFQFLLWLTLVLLSMKAVAAITVLGLLQSPCSCTAFTGERTAARVKVALLASCCCKACCIMRRVS